MPFRFTLQSVFRLRESFERREKQRLAAIMRELLRAQKQLEMARLDRSTAIVLLQRRLEKGMTAAELQFETVCDQSRVRRIAALRAHVHKIEDLRRRQVELYSKIRQQRKVLENLRDRQLAAYHLVQARRAQQAADDRYLMTHAGQFGGVETSFEENEQA